MWAERTEYELAVQSDDSTGKNKVASMAAWKVVTKVGLMV